MSAVAVVILILECVGLASFAASGTIIAVKKRLDVFGALILSFITCFGGGVLRDLVLGFHPPRLFCAREYVPLIVICAGVTLLVFSLAFAGNMAEIMSEHVHNVLMEATDTVGLTFFCIVGVDSALASTAENAANTALLIFCGCITGVGGGVMRDICTAQIPAIFRKHIYFIPALLGSALYVFLLPRAGHLPAILVSAGLILTIRFFAIRFRWNLPTPLTYKEKIAAKRAAQAPDAPDKPDGADRP